MDIEQYKQQCHNIMVKFIEEATQKSISHISQAFDTTVKNVIEKKETPQDLLDYSSVKTWDGVKEYLEKLEREKLWHPHRNWPDLYIDTVQDNERWIINIDWYDNSKAFNLRVSNYGRYVMYDHLQHDPRSINISCRCFDFWITVDYIQVIQKLFGTCELLAKIHLDNSIRFNLNHIIDLLVYLKELSYNRKIVPGWLADVKKENDELKEKYQKYESDILQFEKDKARFQKLSQKYFDLDDEKQLLEERKKKLIIATNNFMVEKEVFRKEKEEFEKTYYCQNIEDI